MLLSKCKKFKGKKTHIASLWTANLLLMVSRASGLIINNELHNWYRFLTLQGKGQGTLSGHTRRLAILSQIGNKIN